MGRIPNGHPRTGGHPSAGVPRYRCRSLVRRYDQTRFGNGEPIDLRKVADLPLSTSSHDDLKKNGAACVAAPVRFRARPRGAGCESFRTCPATAHENNERSLVVFVLVFLGIVPVGPGFPVVGA